jgi:hypothetical protein
MLNALLGRAFSWRAELEVLDLFGLKITPL